MKTHGKNLRFLLFMFCFAGAKLCQADPPLNPPPMPGAGHGQVNNQQGAPLDTGFGFLLIAGTLYAAGKIYQSMRVKKQEGRPAGL